MKQLKWVDLVPTGQGWNAKWLRENRPARAFIRISEASLHRLQVLMNTDKVQTFITLGKTGWAEFQIYPN